MPFYENGVFGDGVALAFALIIGFVFGWFLERGGLGNARKLAGQFYLADMTVLKVMFSAIVTAMLGSFWLARLGLLDLTQVFVPATYVLPQIAGGLIFGVGFVVGGLCPGTSCVAAATGRKDGLAVMAGMCAGILLFGIAFPWLATFYAATPLGDATLPALLGVSRGTVVFVITVLAIGAFAGATRLERRFGGSRA
jgi:hypothetical protein